MARAHVLHIHQCKQYANKRIKRTKRVKRILEVPELSMEIHKNEKLLILLAPTNYTTERIAPTAKSLVWRQDIFS